MEQFSLWLDFRKSILSFYSNLIILFVLFVTNHCEKILIVTHNNCFVIALGVHTFSEGCRPLTCCTLGIFPLCLMSKLGLNIAS